MSSPRIGAVAISRSHYTEFACYPDTAATVFLAGSFNDWSPTATPMKKAADGEWSTSILLDPGRYEYKFVVDGGWCCEPGCTSKAPHCADCVMNEFGTMNRVLEV